MRELKKLKSFISRQAGWNRTYTEKEVESPYLVVFNKSDLDWASEEFVIHKCYRKKTGWEISLKCSGAILYDKYSASTREKTLDKLEEFLSGMSKTSIDNLNNSAKKNMKHWNLAT